MAFEPIDQAELDNLRAQVTNLQTQVSALIDQVGADPGPPDLETIAATHEARLDDLAEQLGTDPDPAVTVEAALADHEARIAALEAP